MGSIGPQSLRRITRITVRGRSNIRPSANCSIGLLRAGAPLGKVYNRFSSRGLKSSMKQAVALLFLLGIPLSPAMAQQQAEPRAPVALLAAAEAGAPELPFAYDGPPPPALPATMIRDTDGKTTVRAVRVSAPLRIDGQLDEALYRSVTPMSDFIQSEPI